jgi:CheY-like chemotaxis protein
LWLNLVKKGQPKRREFVLVNKRKPAEEDRDSSLSDRSETNLKVDATVRLSESLSSTSLAVLLLEDNVHDADLIEGLLEQAGFNLRVKRVDSKPEFLEALGTWQPNLIISDYSLPAYSGRAALTDAKAIRPEIPFIFYSGTIGEERAIEALKEGATDYVLKDRPKRLISSISRALEEAGHKRLHLAAQAKIAAQAKLIDLASDAIVTLDPEGRVLFWNQGAERLYGFSASEIENQKVTDFIYFEPAPGFSKRNGKHSAAGNGAANWNIVPNPATK